MRPKRQAQREALGIMLTTTDPAKEKQEGLSQLRAEGATQRAQYYGDGVFGAQRLAGAGHFLTAVFGGLLNPLHPATPGLSTGSVGHSCLGHSGPPPSLISSFGFQGLTEFLPISSSGHLVITAELLGYQSPGLVLEAAVHVATTLAVIIYFRERFISIIRGAFKDLPTRYLVLMLALSFTVTAVVGLLLSPWVTA